jgi:hypothetical protein
MQAVLLPFAVVPLALFGHSPVALVVVTLVGIAALAVAVPYGLARRSPGAAACLTAPRWRADDALVLYAWVAGVCASLATAVVVLTADDPLVGSPDRIAFDVGFGALAVAIGTVLASSLIDWYYVLPSISGLVRRPPCRDHERDWAGLTQAWFVHRWVATVAVIAGLVLALGAFVGAIAYHLTLDLLDGVGQQEQVKLAATIGAVVVALAAQAIAITKGLTRTVAGDYLDALRTITRLALRPDFSVGDYIRVKLASGEAYEGYVLDVAVEGIKVIPGWWASRPQGRAPRPDSIPIAKLAAPETTVRMVQGPYCSERNCRFVNESYCVYAQRLREQQRAAEVAPAA